jgi:hypothetical protein
VILLPQSGGSQLAQRRPAPGPRPKRGATGRRIAEVTTGVDGRYAFDRVSAGLYELHARPPAGYRAITPASWGVNIVCAILRANFGYQSADAAPREAGPTPPHPGLEAGRPH